MSQLENRSDILYILGLSSDHSFCQVAKNMKHLWGFGKYLDNLARGKSRLNTGLKGIEVKQWPILGLEDASFIKNHFWSEKRIYFRDGAVRHQLANQLPALHIRSEHM